MSMGAINGNLGVIGGTIVQPGGQTYDDLVLSHNPSLFLKCDETSGTTIADHSGNGYDATTTGSWSVYGDPAAPGGGIDWDGGYASVPDHGLLRPAQLTMAMWINATTGGDKGIVTKSSSGSLNNGYGFYRLSGGDYRFYINHYSDVGAGAHTEIGSNSTGGIYDDVWTYVVNTYDGANLKTYINAVLSDTVAYTSAISHSTSPLLVANYPSATPWAGRTAPVEIYPTVLDQADITELFAAA